MHALQYETVIILLQPVMGNQTCAGWGIHPATNTRHPHPTTIGATSHATLHNTANTAVPLN